MEKSGNKYVDKEEVLKSDFYDFCGLGAIDLSDSDKIEVWEQLTNTKVVECKCIKFVGGSKWYKNGCKIHKY